MSVNPPPGRGDENEWDVDEPSGSQWPTSPQQSSTGWGAPPPNQPRPNLPPPPPPGQAAQPPNQPPPPPPGQAPVSPGHPPRPPMPPGRQHHNQSPYGQPDQAQAGPVPRRKRGGLIALFAVVVIVLGVGIGWGAATLFPRSSDDPAAVAASEGAKDENGSSDEASDEASSSTSEPTETESELPDDPKKALEQLAANDGTKVKAEFNGAWVPQLSSKKNGLEAEGKTWDEEAILAEHEQLREEHPRVKLVWSGDFASFKADDFWVTIVGIGFDDPEDALSWCSSHGLGPDSCYAKQLNTSGGHEGTTRLQD